MKVINNVPYHDMSLTYSGRVQRTFGSLLPDRDGVDILDLGCSRGLTTKDIFQLYPGSRVIGIDVNEENVNAARKINKREGKNLRFLVGDGYFPPFKDERFDIVFAMNNLFYAFAESPQEIGPLMPNIGRTVKPDGVLLISRGSSFAGYVRGENDTCKFSMPIIEINDLDSLYNDQKIFEEILRNLKIKRKHLPT
ncbi:MAG: class I SAM-dependent methyltransferase [Nanoarchaeota archaeon]